MYNLSEMNCGPSPEYGKLTITQNDNTATPKTPEIINSLMAITNPLDEYIRNNGMKTDEKILSPSEYTSADTCSSTTSSNVDSPTSPASVQSMCTQLIKEGLKLQLQKKRRNNLSNSETSTSESSCHANPSPVTTPVTCKFPPRTDESNVDTEEDDGNSLCSEANGVNNGLTPEDEERRRRRRERNKIAATKCRLKKRERTVNLVQESETLENQNQDLKSQIQELQVQRKVLVDMLTVHKPTCIKPSPEQSPIFDYQEPPSFMNSNSCSDMYAKTNNSMNKLNDRSSLVNCTETSILPDLQPIETYDFQNTFVKNPSIMLSNSNNDNSCAHLKIKCDKNFGQPISAMDMTNFKTPSCMTVLQSNSYNFLHDQNMPPHYDISLNSIDIV